MSVDVGRMRKRGLLAVRPVHRAVHEPTLAENAEKACRVAMADGVCWLCGGAGWVGPHDVGCPIPDLQKALAMEEFKYKCSKCGRKVKEHRMGPVLKDKECSECFLRRNGPFPRSTTRLPGHTSLAKVYLDLAKAAGKKGDKKAKARYAAEARALIAIVKESNP